MAFTTWSAELTRWKNALAEQDQSTLLKSGWTTSDGQSHTFRNIEDVQNFIKFLEEKVAEESNPGGRRSGPFCIGYRGR